MIHPLEVDILRISHKFPRNNKEKFSYHDLYLSSRSFLFYLWKDWNYPLWVQKKNASNYELMASKGPQDATRQISHRLTGFQLLWSTISNLKTRHARRHLDDHQKSPQIPIVLTIFLFIIICFPWHGSLLFCDFSI